MLTDSDEQLDSMNLLLYMAPIAALLLLPMMLFIEGDVISIVRDQALADTRKRPRQGSSDQPCCATRLLLQVLSDILPL